MTMMLMANWSVFDPGPGSLSTIGRPPKGVAWPFWAQPAWRKKTAVINRLNRLWWRGSAMQVECTYWCITILHIFPIISRYFLHMKQILAGNWRPGGPRPFHRNLCFFFVFLEEAMPSGAATSPLFQPHWDILPKGTLLSSVTCAGRFYASLGP